MLLVEKAAQVASLARLSRHMSPIQAITRYPVDNGQPLLLRIAEGLKHKPRLPSSLARAADPFLPYEAELYVADMGPTHVCLLNKYPVIDNHLLLITREFESQEEPLTQQDFIALSRLLDEADGLIFYNCGADAGASQLHKHMQWVPRTLGERCDRLPLEPDVQPLPFHHHWQSLHGVKSAQAWYDIYQSALQTLGWQPGRAYNLLLTRQWLLVIPRCCANWNGISINSLAFVGSFFVMDSQQAEQLQQGGFFKVLSAVSGWTSATP